MSMSTTSQIKQRGFVSHRVKAADESSDLDAGIPREAERPFVGNEAVRLAAPGRTAQK